MGGFLILLSGARPEILEQCSTERSKYQSLGWVILITSGMATVSMWFALTSALSVNKVIAVPVALLWGLVIMGIDRWLVLSIPASGSRRVIFAIPRVMLAILLGTVISTPLVLKVFESEINAQISVIKERNSASYLAALQKGAVGKSVTTAQANVDRLEKTIDSGGKIVPNPAKDPVVISLTAQEKAEQKLQTKYYNAWQCQLYGGPSCPAKGSGPLAAASKANYENAVAQVASLQRQIRAREKLITANNATADAERVSQARQQLTVAQDQLATAQSRLDTLRQSFDQTNQKSNGLLIRLQALSELTNKNLTLAGARVLLFLLFLVIECLPVTVKLLQRPGNYDAILEMAQAEELKDARRNYRTRSRPVAANGGFDSTRVMEQIWVRPEPTLVVDPSDLPAPVPPADESYESTQFDDSRLRGMNDLRTSANASWSGDGIDLSWSDGER